MILVLIAIISLLSAGLTLFSGFGLGTILTPVFALFFPLHLAIAMTAIVHFLNNLLKFALLGRHMDFKIVLRFGLPAMVAAFVGSKLLVFLEGIPALASYRLQESTHEILLVKVVIAVIMIVFVALEFTGALEKVNLGKQHHLVGGVLSGLFGGLSGHQGALRSLFLIKANLTKEAFLATGIAIACIVDLVRLGVYTERFEPAVLQANLVPLGVAILFSFLGTYIGNKLIKKVTMKEIQILVSIMLVALAVLLGTGLI